MNMPLSTNPENFGPIKVSEDDTHFLVRIHPGIRERAKKISGRQWDGVRNAWVYPKEPSIYEALVDEFQKDADSFNIRRPKTQRPAGIKPPAKQPDDDEFEDKRLEEIPSFGDSGESQAKIHSELEAMRVMLESLKDVAANQSLSLEELRETQKEATKALTKFEPSIQQVVKTKPVEVLPDNLDLTKQKEIELLEKALIRVACLTAGEQKSFLDWVNNHHPLGRPADFVNETHEFLKKQLGKIVGDENLHTDFTNLVQKAKDENLIFNDWADPTIKPIPILFTLNAIRNRFAHPPIDFSQWEKRSRSILYLMNLALVWSRVVMEAEEGNE
jgi:hypothetical protein